MKIEVDDKFIFYGVIIFLITEFLWKIYLEFRQTMVCKRNTQIPTELIGILSQKTFDKARLYALDKQYFDIVTEGLSFACNMLILFLNGLAALWDFGGSMAKNVGYGGSEMLQTVFFIITMNTIQTIITLPTCVYDTFVLEEKHGFNKQTASFFICDKIKSFILIQILSVILGCGINFFSIGDYFFLYLWAFIVVTSLILMIIYPVYIAPLFDKYTPLPEGDLKRDIEKLAETVGFPLSKVLVVDGSKRSEHSNAFYYGLFKNKRIVLFDTLLKDYHSANEKEKSEDDENEEDKTEKKGCDNMEIVSILAHELGHWKLNHVVKNFVILQANLLLILTVFGMLFHYKNLYTAFGFNTQPMFIGLLIVTVFIFGPYFQIFSFCIGILNRHFEFQADKFAKVLGRGHFLKLSLIKLNRDNLSFPIYDPLYSQWNLSHPPLLERLKALDKVE